MHNSLDASALDILLEYWMLPSDSFMSCLHSLLGYSTGGVQALQLIVLAAFGALDLPLASCMLVHFFENLVQNDSGFVSLT